jgi:hypothetical protein
MHHLIKFLLTCLHKNINYNIDIDLIPQLYHSVIIKRQLYYSEIIWVCQNRMINL